MAAPLARGLRRPLLKSLQKSIVPCQSSMATDSTPTTAERQPRTALFFPGQGVQRVGMTTDWLENFPSTVKPLLDEIDDTLKTPLTRIIAEGPNSLLTATNNAQPAIMATSVIILRVLEQDFGLDTSSLVDVALGHSLGEFAALVAGGYLRYADALLLTRKRAEAMTAASRAASERFGSEVGMVAIVTEPEVRDALIGAIHNFLRQGVTSVSSSSSSSSSSSEPLEDQVLIANINSKNQIVLSGSISGITTLLTHLRNFGGHDPRAVRLKADSPFHSPLMQPAKQLTEQLLNGTSAVERGEDIISWPGRFPIVSNVSARPFRTKTDLRNLLARQCIETVRWHESIQYLHQEETVRRWIGIGPGKVGRNLVGKEVGMKGAVKGGGVWGISEPREIDDLLRGLEASTNYDEELEARFEQQLAEETLLPTKEIRERGDI